MYVLLKCELMVGEEAMELTQARIPILMASLRESLGEDFFNEYIDHYVLEPQNTSRKPSHPLALWWKTLEADWNKVLTTDNYYLSKESLLVLWLSGGLIALEAVENRERLLISLREPGTFHSSFFEVTVAASYVEMGFDLAVVNESTESGVRTCDFIIRNRGEEVYIECKSLDDKLVEERPRWQRLCDRVLELMLKFNRSWVVTIKSNGELSDDDANQILNLIRNDIRTGMRETRQLNERLEIHYQEVALWGQLIKCNNLEISGAPTSVVTFKLEGEFDNGQLQGFRNLALVEGMPFFERDISKRLVNNAKNARGQLSKDKPGIIHIAVPYEYGSSFLDVVDDSYWPLFAKLQKDFRRANAVVISSYICQPNPQLPISFEHYIVPNNNAYNGLPEWFKVLGTMEFGFPIEAAQGTVVSEFKPVTPVPGEQLPLLGQVSRDGRYQLKAWLTWNGSLRVDFATPSFPRSFVQCPPDGYHLSDERNIFCFVWDGKEGMDLWLNGTQICSKAMTGKATQSTRLPSDQAT